MILISFHSNSPVDIICLGFIEGILHATILRRQWECIWYRESPSAKRQISQVSTQLKLTCSESTVKALEKKFEICSKLTIKTAEQRYWRRSGVSIVNFEHVSLL